MKNLKDTLHRISYLQYPFYLASIWFYIPSLQNDDWVKLNYALILFGIGISFTTLADTKKVTFKFEEKIWKNPKKAKRFIVYVGFIIFSFFAFGIFGYFLASNMILKEISIGIIVVGIGFIGILKMSVEYFENFREDNPIHDNKQ